MGKQGDAGGLGDELLVLSRSRLGFVSITDFLVDVLGLEPDAGEVLGDGLVALLDLGVLDLQMLGDVL